MAHRGGLDRVNVADARADLETKLSTHGLDIVPPGGGAVPRQCFIVAADPFLQPSLLSRGAMTVTFAVVCLLGSASDGATVAAIDGQASLLAGAIYLSAPWTLGTVQPPAPYDVGAISYVALSATTSRLLTSEGA